MSIFLQQIADKSANDKDPEKDENIEITKEVKKLNELLKDLSLATKKIFCPNG